jgi:hypothetical protein
LPRGPADRVLRCAPVPVCFKAELVRTKPSPNHLTQEGPAQRGPPFFLARGASFLAFPTFHSRPRTSAKVKEPFPS